LQDNDDDDNEIDDDDDDTQAESEICSTQSFTDSNAVNDSEQPVLAEDTTAARLDRLFEVLA
jgi:hypothetical protein